MFDFHATRRLILSANKKSNNAFFTSSCHVMQGEESVNVEQANMPSIESCDLSDHDRSCPKIIFNGATKTYKN